MIKILAVLALSLVATIVNAGPTEIFLPPDADELTIVGNGFRLRIDQLNQAKQDWSSAAVESSKVEFPRIRSEPVANDKLFEETNQGKPLGPIEGDLMQWITTRATSLSDRVIRYESEVQLGDLSKSSRIVAEILFLNTLVDLRNLVKENIVSLRWVRNKLRQIGKLNESFASEVVGFVSERIDANKNIERGVKGTNQPGDKWVNNTQVVKRILNEQRFSSELSKMIINYLGGSFSMMQRARVFDQNRSDKNTDDGLYYGRSKGRMPRNYPFSLQDAIMNGA